MNVEKKFFFLTISKIFQKTYIIFKKELGWFLIVCLMVMITVEKS